MLIAGYILIASWHPHIAVCYFLLPTSYFLRTTHYFLLLTSNGLLYLLLTTYACLRTACCLLHTAHHLLPATYVPLSVYLTRHYRLPHFHLALPAMATLYITAS